MPKISEYLKTFKAKEGKNKLLSFYTNDEKLFESIKLFELGLKILKILK